MSMENTRIPKACFALVMISAVVILPADVVASVDIHRISLMAGKYWSDGVLEAQPYGFSAHVNGNGITHVAMTPPGGSPIPLDLWEAGPGWSMWGASETGDYATLAALRAAFPIGDYLFSFNGGADSVTVPHYPAEPTGFADITYPPHGAADVSVNPIITWGSCVAHGDGLGLMLWDETAGQMVSVDYPHVNIAQTSWFPGTLQPGHSHELEVAVFEGTVSQPSTRTTSQGDSFEYYDLFEYANTVSFTTEAFLNVRSIQFMTTKEYIGGTLQTNPFGLWAMVFGDGINSVEVTSPGNAATIVGEPRDGWWILDLAEDYPSMWAMRADFPIGNYTFTFNKGEQTEDSATVWTEPEEPSGFANITYPPYGATQVPESPTFIWESCLDYGEHLYVDVGDEDHDVLLYQDGLYIGSTNWTPPGSLVPGCLHSFVVSVQTGYPIGQLYSTENGDGFEYHDVYGWGNEVFFIVGERPISDHVFSIGIANSWDYNEPSNSEDLTYEFDFDIVTDHTVESIKVTTPGTPHVSSGFTFEIPELPDQWDNTGRIRTNWEFDPESGYYNWEYGATFTDPCDLYAYGDGWYTIAVFYAGGIQDETMVWFGIPGSEEPIPQPTQEPVLTSPSHHEVVDWFVTVCWEECNDTNAVEIRLLLQKEATGEQIEQYFETKETCWDPKRLTNGSWEAELDFEQRYLVPDNGDGIPVSVGKCSEADYRFEVVQPAEIEVKLRGTSIHDGQPQPIDLGTIVQNISPSEWKFIVDNVGGMPLEVGTVYLHNNNGFEVTRQPDTNIGPNSGTFFKVKMLTDTLGSKSADIEFANSDRSENPFNFTLVGTVEEPYIDLITDVRFADQLPPYVLSGRKTPIDLYVMVANAGNYTIDTRIDIEIFARPVGAADDSEDVLIEALPDYCRVPPPVPPMPGRSYWHKLKIYIPADMAPSEYVLGVKVDSSDEVEESKEHNNTALTAESIEVVEPYIDLIADVWFIGPVPPSVVFGRPIRLDLGVAISNVGNITVDTRMDIEVFARPVGAVDDSQDVLLWMGRPPVPGPHSTFGGRLPPIDLPPGMAPGRYFLGLKVDSSNEVQESNEDNNTALTTESIRVIGPFVDLIAGVWFKGQPPTFVEEGIAIVLWVAVGNIGDLQLMEKVDFEIFVRPVGAVDDSQDVLVKTDSCYVPPPRRRVHPSIEVIFWPSGMAPGVYLIGVKVDPSNEVDEFHEDNNTALTTKAVVVLPW